MVAIVLNIKIRLNNIEVPVWGNLDILKACGALDSGSNPGAGVNLNFTKFCIVIVKDITFYTLEPKGV